MDSETTAGRGAVIAAGSVAVFFFAQRLIADDSLYASFIKAAIAAFAVMVIVATGRRLWQGDTVGGAQAPGGWGLSFARATLRPLRTLETRVNEQMTAMNDRMLATEEEVAQLKGSAPGPETEE